MDVEPNSTIPLNRFGRPDGRYSKTTEEERTTKLKEYKRAWYLAHKREQAEYMAERYKRKREEILKRVREYSKQNRDKIKAYRAIYYDKRKEWLRPILSKAKRERRARDVEAQRIKDKEYRKKARERILRNHKKYWTTHRDSILQSAARYRMLHPETSRCNAHVRNARIRGASIGNTELIKQWEVSWRNKKRVRCYWCGKLVSSKKAHSDHRIPISKGGPHCVENMVISCAFCNLSKGARLPEEWNTRLSTPTLLL